MLASNGYRIYATEHTAQDFIKNGIECKILHKVSEKKKPNILDYITSKKLKLVINIPGINESKKSQRVLRDEYLIRRKSVEFGVPVVTNLELTKTLAKSLEVYSKKKL